VLLAKRATPPFKWSFPGGSLEPGENAAQAAMREAREEVGVEIEIAGQAGEREVSLTGKRYVISVFAARLVSGEAMPSAEASETGWFKPAEIASLDATEGLAELVVAAQRLLLAGKA
jgi:ADP-ribose pyrophosphatase YjhB (NUDIX family)